MAETLVLSGARLPDGSIRDLVVRDGRFADAEAAGASPRRLALAGSIVVPGLIDSHLHLDKTLLGGPWRPHQAGNSVADRIETERRLRPGLTPGVAERGEALIRLAVGNGTTALRTHVDIDDEVGLGGLGPVLDLRERWRGKVAIQVVAFPQSGIVRRPPVADLLGEALRMGADLVGGLDPVGIDGDRNRHLGVVFDLAARHGKGVDIHLHEAGESGLVTLLRIAEMTAVDGLSGRVAVSHAFCLGSVDERAAARAADALARAGVAIITAASGAYPIPPVDLLRAAGVRVAAGSDNVRDLWSPFGNASMLERCMLVAYRTGWRTDEALTRALDLATSEAAAVLGLPDCGIAPGRPATCAVFPAEHVPMAIVERPRPRLVLSGGIPIHDPQGLVS